ncbi:MAG TPA: hypothetical protein VH063_10535 [Gaiellaceae bacterium]|jgi:hypothetical protein|nr:hypothetical protein [Gaiellaceae bacterium]
MSRRAFLVVSAGGTAAVTGLPDLMGGFGAVELAEAADIQAAVTPTTSIAVRRSLDQCVLTLDLYNLEPKYGGAVPVLHQTNTKQPSYLSVTLKPQHVAEQSFILTDDAAHALKAQPDGTPRTDPGAAPTAPPVDSAVAGGTQLVFIVPASVLDPNTAHPLPFDTATLLNWSSLAMSVVPNAVAQGAKPTHLDRPSAPGTLDTAIELPFRVQLSPVGSSAWVNAAEPVTHDGWTELWHTRLAAKLGGLQVVIPPTNGIQLDADIIDVPQWFEDDAHRDDRTVRAIWCLDDGFSDSLSTNAMLPASNMTPFDTSLQPRDRADIVRLSSDFGLVAHNRTTSSGGAFIPSAATVDRMILTTFGATTDLEDHWDLANGGGHDYNSSLLQWRHRTWGGRDTHVRVVRKGYLFPLGHRASLITINERKLSTGSGSPGAYLRERIFLVVGQPVKSYYQAPFIGNDGRKLPFTSIEVVTLTTPDLDAEKRYVTGLEAAYCFQPKTDGQPFLFHFRGTDFDGQLTDFRAPVVWVDDTIAYGSPGISPNNQTLDEIIQAIIDKWRAAYPPIDLRRARVSIAPPNVAGDTNVSLESFELGVEHTTGGSRDELADAAQPNFIPTAHTLTLHMPEVSTMSGNNVGGPVLEYHGTYLANGFDGTTDSNGHQVVNPHAQNPGEIILSKPSSIANSPGVKFAADKGGGAVTPNFSIDAYTRTLGPAGAGQGGDISAGLANLAKGKFDPTAIFDAANAHLLGGVPLASILGTMSFGAGAESGEALQLTNRQTSPTQITTVLDWQPPLIPGGPTLAGQQVNIFFPVDGDTKYEGTGDPPNDPGISGLFNLHAVVVTDLSDATKSTYSIVGQLQTFELDLFGDGTTYFLQIPFNSLTFHAQKDKKTEVQVDVGDVEFKGALDFVQEMASFLSFTGSGLTISTEGAGITVDLQVSIPSIGIGVLSIENIAFDAGCLIPYNGDPVAFNFSFCTRENPFNLSVMGFEGGGFVGLAITAKGLEMLEFSFEFGIGYSIDIGIASGNVELDGGIYFEISTRSDGTQALEFTAFIKAGGGVSALGIISVSVELYLALTYESGDSSAGLPAKLIGEADLMISVHVLFFGGTVTIGMQEEFDAGSSDASPAVMHGREIFSLAAADDDPPPTQTIKTFGDLIDSADVWSQYTTAFVPAGG